MSALFGMTLVLLAAPPAPDSVHLSLAVNPIGNQELREDLIRFVEASIERSFGVEPSLGSAMDPPSGERAKNAFTIEIAFWSPGVLIAVSAGDTVLAEREFSIALESPIDPGERRELFANVWLFIRSTVHRALLHPERTPPISSPSSPELPESPVARGADAPHQRAPASKATTSPSSEADVRSSRHFLGPGQELALRLGSGFLFDPLYEPGFGASAAIQFQIEWLTLDAELGYYNEVRDPGFSIVHHPLMISAGFRFGSEITLELGVIQVFEWREAYLRNFEDSGFYFAAGPYLGLKLPIIETELGDLGFVARASVPFSIVRRTYYLEDNLASYDAVASLRFTTGLELRWR